MIRLLLNLLLACVMPLVLVVIAILLLDDWLTEIWRSRHGQDRRPE